MSNPPVAVQKYGQSIWIDNIRRKLLTDGTFTQWIDQFGVVGVTSNPTIFQKAIGGSDDYDETIKTMLSDDVDTIYERLAVADIQAAVEMFRPIYDATEGRDGYVSLEVSPLLAHDTQGTIEEAKRLYQAVNAPNVMIKIPATPEGIPAIEETIYTGINVNVTLIFSVTNYLQVAEAYIRGLERRQAEGKPIQKIASVASFFLSRIDTMIDQMLQNNVRAAQGRDIDRVAANNRLLGKAAIANAKLAYKHFMTLFYGDRFAQLRAAGAQVQRPLWASTSTKNPAYADTMYVDALIGRDTVNTLPPETLAAFKDHGTADHESILDAIDQAQEVLDMLAEVGIDIDQITKRLQDDGVEAFANSFTSLIEQVDAKRTLLQTGLMSQTRVALGIYGDAVQSALKALDQKYINARIWSKEGSVWKDHGPTIAKIEQRLGWLDVLDTIDLERVKALQGQMSAFSHLVLLGMGGSSLAPEVLSETFGHTPGYPRFLMLDSTVPERIKQIEDAIDLPNTLFIVASKSGSTIETDCFYRYFYDKTGGNGRQFIAITDPGSQLAQTAQAEGFREVFLNPADIGGRYSALSYFGIVPAALMGIDVQALWDSAGEVIRSSNNNVSAAQHPSAYLGAIIGALALNGRDKLCLFCSPSIATFGSWVEQLVAESTGKEGKGILPVVGATVGKPHDYASDRVFVYLKVEGDPGNEELDPGIRALREAGHPRITITLKDRFALGGEFFRWEYATAIAGHLLEINPFDEPNVTESKNNTSRLLDHFQAHGHFPETTPLLQTDAVKLYLNETTRQLLFQVGEKHGYDTSDVVQLLAAQLIGTHAGDYFAILAYLPQDPAISEKLEEIRRRIRHVTRRAVTVGYGPRYLHSTGQLHKGGANNGVFLQFTHDDALDLAIPGMPFSFGTLKTAQAAGDFEALSTHKRRALRIHLGDHPLNGLDTVLAAIQFAESRNQ
ncbi:MAG: bifunctional transaldolase/phosoglucose isomerase [Anaerolineae bacterium]|jgi:transaldolase/glucose-6-phosphate isomerase|nr:bifunctional transaldolase/phosoglucose isomerase [Anaerolineae bacterium]